MFFTFSILAEKSIDEIWSYVQTKRQVLPLKRHKAVNQSSGKISYIERFNNTLRQRVSGLIKKTSSFPKKIENQLSALSYFIDHYNAALFSICQLSLQCTTTETIFLVKCFLGIPRGGKKLVFLVDVD